MAMDLDQDYTVNGHTFKAGKGVDTNVTEADALGKTVKNNYEAGIKEIQERNAEMADLGGHTSGVPTTSDPTEPTSGTPTRPDGTGNSDKETGDK